MIFTHHLSGASTGLNVGSAVLWAKKDYAQLKVDAVIEREKNSQAILQNLQQSLAPILKHASSKKIVVGIESRRLYEEIPTERELAVLLDNLPDPALGYWHNLPVT